MSKICWIDIKAMDLLCNSYNMAMRALADLSHECEMRPSVLNQLWTLLRHWIKLLNELACITVGDRECTVLCLENWNDKAFDKQRKFGPCKLDHWGLTSVYQQTLKIIWTIMHAMHGEPTPFLCKQTYIYSYTGRGTPETMLLAESDAFGRSSLLPAKDLCSHHE